MNVFDQILQQFVPDEADRAVISKYPQLAESYNQVAAKNLQNQQWFSENLVDDSGKTKKELALEEQLRQHQERIAAMAASGGDMNFDEILAGLKAKGFVSGDDLTAKIADVDKTFSERINNRDSGVLHFFAKTANLAVQHKEEFGEPFDAEGFVKQYQASGTYDPKAVYDSLVAAKREEKRNAEIKRLQEENQTLIEKARKEGEEAGRRAAAMESVQLNGGLPVDQGRNSGAASMGWLQRRQLDRSMAKDENGNQVVPGGKLGDGTATAAIMEQLRKDIADGKIAV